MANHVARIAWQLSKGDFIDGAYSREHTWTFDGGITIPASPATTSVPLPYSSEAAVDPEEAFVASISSCHMLTFLYLAHKAGIEVLAYEDNAVGRMTMNERKVKWVSLVELHPRIEYGRNGPSPETERDLHHDAHEQCFIANSVKTEIRVV
jgi:organic hydroperoxide reductase OsmC/OhrA